MACGGYFDFCVYDMEIVVFNYIELIFLLLLHNFDFIFFCYIKFIFDFELHANVFKFCLRTNLRFIFLHEMNFNSC